MFSAISRLAVAILCLQAWSLISAAANLNQPELEVTAGTVKDTRPNGGDPGKLEIEVKVSMSKPPAEATHYRVAAIKAVDDTGVDLMPAGDAATGFQPLHEHGSFKVSLKSPNRTAGHIREVDGEVQLLVPKRDPGATVKISAVRKSLGKTIELESLKSAGMEVMPVTREQFVKLEAADDEREWKERERHEIQAAEDRAAKQPRTVDREKVIANIKAGFARQRKDQASARQDFGFNRLGPNDIAVRLKDPNKKVVTFEFVDKDGKKIPAGFSFSTEQRGSEVRCAYIFQFQSPLPPTASLLIHLVSDKALLKVPFTLTDIPLP